MTLLKVSEQCFNGITNWSNFIVQIVFFVLLTAVVLLARELYGARKKIELLSKAPPKQESYEAKDLLKDLLAGSALVQVKRLDPSEVFLRSPRNVG